MKVSVALCTFNGEKYIQEQLESLLNQTRKPDEIVISDDGSTDQTMKVILAVERTSKLKFTYFNHLERFGVFKNFSETMAYCTGDIIFPCDQDDVWKLDKIERHLCIHEQKEAIDLVYSNADVVLNTQEHYLYPLWNPKQIYLQMEGYASKQNLVFKGKSIAGCCTSVKRDFYHSILPIPDEVFHDDWIATSASLLNSIYGIPESLIYYRQHGQNVVGIIRGSKLSYWKSLFTNVAFYVKSDTYIYERHRKVFPAIQNHPRLSKTIKNDELDEVISLYHARSYYQNKAYQTSIKALTQAYFHHQYRLFNGVWTYLKDLYNLSFIKLIHRSTSD